MGEQLKDTILDLLEATVELQKATLKIYKYKSAPKRDVAWVKSLASRIHNIAQDLP